MACLSNEQIEYIRKELKKRGVSHSFLFEEWLDHVCCDVESLMNKGLDFEDAFSQVSGSKAESEVKSAHDTVQQFLNHRYVGIKKLLLFAFLVFSAGWLVNLQYGGAWVGLASFLILSLVYLRISFDFMKKRFLHRVNILLSVLSLLTFLVTLSGIVLIFLNRNYGISTRGHGVDLTVFGWFFFSLACLVYYSREARSAIETTDRKKNLWYIALSAANVILAGISIATFPLYHYVQAYLFYLILFILAFNLLSITALLLSRSMKHTLVLSMVIGSFMIVFIHSPFRSKLPGGKPELHQVSLQVSPDEKAISWDLYIYMYYDKFPDKPITLPMRESGSKGFEITMPSYTYRGYLYYSIRKDSTDAREYFSANRAKDSVRLNIPKNKVYQLNY